MANVCHLDEVTGIEFGCPVRSHVVDATSAVLLGSDRCVPITVIDLKEIQTMDLGWAFVGGSTSEREARAVVHVVALPRDEAMRNHGAGIAGECGHELRSGAPVPPFGRLMSGLA
jgi:hypothetical protein